MRPCREITEEEENFRIEMVGPFGGVIKRDPVAPEVIGTVIILAFRIAGYSQDFDGSLMANLEEIDHNLETTGLTIENVGLYPQSGLVATEDELAELFNRASCAGLTPVAGDVAGSGQGDEEGISCSIDVF